MPIIEFIRLDGSSIEADVAIGTSVMQAAVREGIEEILAECGGAAACGTCHVLVDREWINKLPPPDFNERSMLECVEDCQENSRLSCQISMSDELDGIRVYVMDSQN